MATAAVASAAHATDLGLSRRHFASSTTTPGDTDYCSLTTVNWADFDPEDFTHEQRVAFADLVGRYRDGTLSPGVRKLVDSQVSRTALTHATPTLPGRPHSSPPPGSNENPANRQNKGTLKSKSRNKSKSGKSVTFDLANLPSHKGGRNDGNDGITESTLLKTRDWKTRSSRATPLKAKKLTQVQKAHWAAFEEAYESARDGGDEWAHVPTSTMTLQKDFPTLYRYATRPDDGLADSRTQAKWDEENDRRMDLKLKPLREITGPTATTGSRATAWAELDLDGQRTWARDTKMMRDKYMSVLCSTADERRAYLGLQEGDDESALEGMKRVQERMATARIKAWEERQAKYQRKISKRLATTVPLETSDTRYSRLIDGALDDQEAFATSQRSQDTVVRRRGREEYLTKIRKKKYLTDEEKSTLYSPLDTADDLTWLIESGASRSARKGFAQDIKRIRQAGQTVVRPSVLFDHKALARRGEGRREWSTLEDTDLFDEDEESSGGSSSSRSSGTSSGGTTSNINDRSHRGRRRRQDTQTTSGSESDQSSEDDDEDDE